MILSSDVLYFVGRALKSYFRDVARVVGFSAIGLSGPAWAIDVSQVDIPQRTGVSIEPAHQDHVLVETKRSFDLRRQSAHWFVLEPERDVALLPEDEEALRREDEEQQAKQIAAREAEVARVEAEKHPLVLVAFEFDKAVMASGLVDFSPILAKGKPLSSVVKIIGHADEAGSDPYNMKLSQRRAECVARALVKAGIPKVNLLVTWVGKRAPIDAANAEKNRVVEVRVVRTAEDSRS